MDKMLEDLAAIQSAPRAAEFIDKYRQTIRRNHAERQKMTTEPMTRANIFLPPEMIARLKEQKERTGVPVAEFVRRAIEEALKKVGNVLTRQS